MQRRSEENPKSPAPNGGDSGPDACLDLAPGEEAEWDRFATGCEGGTVFHTAWWYRAWGMTPRIRVIRGQGARIEGGICFALARRWGAMSIVRPPMTPRNGPVLTPTAVVARHARYTHDKRTTLSVLCGLPRVGMYDFLVDPRGMDAMPYLWNGFDVNASYTYVIRHSPGCDWTEGASKTQRYQIRRSLADAEKQSLTVDCQPKSGELVAILADSAGFKGYGFETIRSRFPVWWQAAVERNVVNGYVLRDGSGEAISASVVVRDRNRAYYVAGGIRSQFRKASFANTYLIHRMISDAHGAGLDFDFEGSTLPGVERFFRSFGGELQPYYRVIKARSPLAAIAWFGGRWLANHRRDWAFHE